LCVNRVGSRKKRSNMVLVTKWPYGSPRFLNDHLRGSAATQTPKHSNGSALSGSRDELIRRQFGLFWHRAHAQYASLEGAWGKSEKKKSVIYITRAWRIPGGAGTGGSYIDTAEPREEILSPCDRRFNFNLITV